MDVFLLFYELSDNQVEILSFWDCRQNPDKRIDKL
jgi:hypothetical protein